MNALEVAKILPPDNAVSRPFWEGCRAGELRLQCCDACGQFQFYPRIVCSHCSANRLSWRAVSGRGHIASFTVVRRGISKAYPAPYVVVLVDLEEGPRMMSTIVGSDPESVAVGQGVVVQFESWGADHVLPVFRVRENE